jgi:crotonobetainyl-CoA:carnitine CoA-transferase CaiB-like acyl-CoA transferase
MGTHHPEEKYWPVFCEITGQSALLSDPRFKDNDDRIANCPELVEIFDKVFESRTQEEWMNIFQESSLMFSPVYRNHDVLTDEQALVNNYLVDFKHPLLGDIKIPGYPIHFSENSAGIQSSAPTLGEHTDQVLGNMGFTDEEIQKFREDEVIP